ncbi:MAG: D-alanine--D-alanine ligase [Fimbriimonadales bacterium]|nr:D-alanine--D-alanine ligase [Fimbriimonadales bacterium]
MRTPEEIATQFAPPERFGEVRGLYLVGIGGAGMSGLALILRRRGVAVRGCDAAASETTDLLKDAGVPVTVGCGADDLQEGWGVVLSDAIPLDAPEPLRARRLGLPLFRRSQLLGWLAKGRKTIAVTGSHGKTTTTGLIARAMIDAGLRPLVVVGAAVPEFGGPIVAGDGEWAVLEACEAYNGMLDLDPTIVVLTNLEWEHVDFHRSFESLVDSVLAFVRKLPPEGTLVYCSEDPGARLVAERFEGRKRAYGPLPEGLGLAIPGAKNRWNAGGALEACVAAGLDPSAVAASLGRFRGAERRLQVVEEAPITVLSDYAHNPTEIVASVEACREAYPGRRLVVAYQPHLFSRTQGKYREFADALSLADRVFLTDIYPAREDPIPGVSSARIAELLANGRYVPCRHLLPRVVAAEARDGDVVVGMGAGTIGSFPSEFLRERRRLGREPEVLVVCGGDSPEREVSLVSGLSVEQALRAKGVRCRRADLSDLLLGGGNLSLLVGPDRPDVVFLAVHGTNAEDGAIQGLCRLAHVPFTGSDLLASALAMDKARAKRVLEAAGLRVPRGVELRSPDDPVPLDPPLVVKPNAQGSTIGMGFVRERAQLGRAIARAFEYDRTVLVEEWIEGVELSVPILGDRALPAVEIVPRSGTYDFASKYELGATEEIVPARLPEQTLRRAEAAALAAHRALGCCGLTRTDMIVRDGEPFVLEVNTLPGLTPTSLVPRSARAAGIEFGDLCLWMVHDALERSKQEAP